MSSVTITETRSTVSVTASENLVTVQANSTPSIATAIAVGPQGPMGPQGVPGDTNIGGYPVQITGISSGDILAFGGTNWFNDPQSHLTDGGNF